MKTYLLFSLSLILIFIFSCQKDVLDTSSQRILKFSTDTLSFDTVFQTLGSATRSFKIYNPTDKSILISNSSLNRGANTTFRYNIDGLSGSNAKNITILPNDSAWVFVEVTVNPASNPLWIQDSLIIESNGAKQSIILHAIGQNAYFHKGEVITSSTLWKNDKPHVILAQNTSSGYVPGVIVSTGSILSIQEGAQLYFGSSAGILVQGSLRSVGTKTNKVQMRGVRLEKEYIHAAGQWLGILIERNSKNNLIEYTTIDETAFGIWLGFQNETDYTKLKDDMTRADLVIRNSSIKNGYYWTLRSINNKITAENSEFFTSTDFLIQLYLGGEYIFRNCTIFNNQSKDLKGNIALSNKLYDDQTSQTYKNKLTSALFQNCIIESTVEEAIALDIDLGVNSIADYKFENCLYKSKSNFSNTSFINCIRNVNPSFESTIVDKENLKLKSGSPCIDKGIANSLLIDFEGNPRTKGSAIDIGAFEF